jgi:hypothetical protein
VEFGGEGLIFGRHASVLPTPPTARHNGRLALIWRVLRPGVCMFAGSPSGYPRSALVRFYLGGAMKVIRRIAVAAVVAAGLFVSMSGPASADVADVIVGQHKHCLLTPNGWVPIAGGVSVEAYEQDAPALDQLHGNVHTGTPTDDGGPLRIVKVDKEDEDCASAPAE